MDFSIKWHKKYDFIFLALSVFMLLLYFLDINISKNTSKITTEKADIVFVLDVSKSMNAIDYSDNSRLTVAKNTIKEFIASSKENKYSLVIFAWEAISVIPLTDDIEVFYSLLENVDYTNLTKQSTDFYTAISLAISRFNTSESKIKSIIMLTDGWDDEQLLTQKIKKLDIKQFHFFVVWIWSLAWAMIPDWVDVFARTIYKKYNWEYVISALNKAILEKLATSLNWNYFDLENISDIKKSISKLNTDIKEKQQVVKEQTQKSLFFVYLSFFFFFLYLFSYIIPWKQK